MKEILLHIGKQKTGTTSLQEYFYKNRKKLRENGVYYPKTGLRGQSHSEIAGILQQPVNPSNQVLIEELLREITNCGFHKIIISCEGLEKVSPQKLKNVFTGYQLKPIVYLRNQVDFLASCYLQHIQETFKSTALEDFLTLSRNSKLDYKGYLRKYKSVFGNDIGVSLYDKDYLYNGDIVDDFLEKYLKEERSSLPERNNLRRNRSIGWHTARFKLALNEHIATQEKTPVRLFLILENLSNHFMKDEKFEFTPDQKREIYERYHATNMAVSEEYFGGYVFDKLKINQDAGCFTLNSDTAEFLEQCRLYSQSSFYIYRFLRSRINAFSKPHYRLSTTGFIRAITCDMQMIIRNKFYYLLNKLR